MRVIRVLIIICMLLCAGRVYAEHAGEAGYCALCETMIMDKVYFFYIENEEYNEARFELSDGSKCRIGLCDKHYSNLSKDDFPMIMQGVRRGWSKEFTDRKWTQEQIDEYKKEFFVLEINKRVEKDR